MCSWQRRELIFIALPIHVSAINVAPLSVCTFLKIVSWKGFFMIWQITTLQYKYLWMKVMLICVPNENTSAKSYLKALNANWRNHFNFRHNDEPSSGMTEKDLVLFPFLHLLLFAERYCFPFHQLLTHQFSHVQNLCPYFKSTQKSETKYVESDSYQVR